MFLILDIEKIIFLCFLSHTKKSSYVAPWCSGCHYWIISINWAWALVLRRFKPCSRRIGDSRWWGYLTMVPAGNKAKHLSSVNHTTKKQFIIHQFIHESIFSTKISKKQDDSNWFIFSCFIRVCWRQYNASLASRNREKINIQSIKLKPE